MSNPESLPREYSPEEILLADLFGSVPAVRNAVDAFVTKMNRGFNIDQKQKKFFKRKYTV